MATNLARLSQATALLAGVAPGGLARAAFDQWVLGHVGASGPRSERVGARLAGGARQSVKWKAIGARLDDVAAAATGGR